MPKPRPRWRGIALSLSISAYSLFEKVKSMRVLMRVVVAATMGYTGIPHVVQLRKSATKTPYVIDLACLGFVTIVRGTRKFL